MSAARLEAPDTRSRTQLSIFRLSVVIPTLALIAALVLRDADSFDVRVLLWAVLIGAIELMPVPAWGSLTISVGFPLLMMVAILYPPGAAALITLLGASDPLELRREVSFATAIFNRCQVALSVLAASATFHAVGNLDTSAEWVLVFAASVAAIADYVVNGGIVALYMSLRLGIQPLKVIKDLRVGSLGEFLVGYLGLGILGLTLAVFYSEIGWWSLFAFLAPVLFARQMFFRSKALEEAHKELKEREEVLRELSNTMAEERADERLQIAGYLHDDLAQVLFRLSLQVDIAKKLLDKNDLEELAVQLGKIKASKQETSNRIRALIRDLHRSPLGATGLAEAFQSFVDEVGGEAAVEFHLDVEDIALPAPIALLIFHIGREGVMNGLKHANARDMWISVRRESDDIVLRLRDNGVGFDVAEPGPEGHFGMAMMRERAKVGGGSFELESARGDGTLITVRFPTALLQRERLPDSSMRGANGQAHVFPDTQETTLRSGVG
jgi:signal transduction histidine kinase